MERLSGCLDSLLMGLFIGLGLCIIVSISVIVVENFYTQKNMAQAEIHYQQSAEQHRKSIEGWTE